MSLVEQELPTLSEHVRSPGFSGGASAARTLMFCEGVCGSLFLPLFFVVRPLHCLSFFNLRLLITLGYLQFFHVPPFTSTGCQASVSWRPVIRVLEASHPCSMDTFCYFFHYCFVVFVSWCLFTLWNWLWRMGRRVC